MPWSLGHLFYNNKRSNDCFYVFCINISHTLQRTRNANNTTKLCTYVQTISTYSWTSAKRDVRIVQYIFSNQRGTHLVHQHKLIDSSHFSLAHRRMQNKLDRRKLTTRVQITFPIDNNNLQRTGAPSAAKMQTKSNQNLARTHTHMYTEYDRITMANRYGENLRSRCGIFPQPVRANCTGYCHFVSHNGFRQTERVGGGGGVNFHRHPCVGFVASL